MSVATEMTVYDNETWNQNLKCLKHIAHLQNNKKTQNKDVVYSGTNYFIIINYTMG